MRAGYLAENLRGAVFLRAVPVMSAETDPQIADAAAVLAAGGLVAMPTETVYGLAADARNDHAVARIFAVKGRPSFNPLIAHVADVEAAARLAHFSPLAERLAAAFWPGPLTLVLPRRAESGLSLLVSAGLDSVALRAPAHPIARALLSAFGGPIAAPSANPSGGVSPTLAAHVRESLGDKIDRILDGGPAAIGLESTIVKVDGPRLILLRPGGLPTEMIAEAVGAPVERPSISSGIEAPGMLESHYAPHAALRINIETPHPDEAYLAFGPAPTNHAHTFNLSPTRDLQEAAANLFAALRAADAAVAHFGLAGVAAAPLPQRGLGEAINDRLRRAAAPR